MAILTIDGATLRQMIAGAAALLESERERVDALNVFPVPDGDTGTNMSLTMKSAAKGAAECTGTGVGAVAEALSRGALRGARGNSGVILSQLFRGFARALSGLDTVDAAGYAAALKNGVDTAYKAVMKPQEGTILTVSRLFAAGAADAAAESDDVLEVMRAALASGDDALLKTTDMLKALKQAGVVDAGGTGWMVINRGFYNILSGETTPEAVVSPAHAAVEAPAVVSAAAEENGSIEFGYCSEYIIQCAKAPDDARIAALRAELASFGDCVVVVADDTIVKVHCHSNTPDRVIHNGLLLGDLVNIKIDNMREQHRSLVVEAPAAPAVPAAPAAPEKPYGMVAVASGDGLKSVLKELGVDAFIEGGQTMNPSADDIANAVRSVPAKNVFMFPNNSNIILAAQQAGEMVEQNAILIPTKSIPQGMAAALAFNPDADPAENEAAMREAASAVKTGQVTYAIRDSVSDGITIHTGDYLGLTGKTIVSAGKDLTQIVLDLLGGMVEDEEILSLYYGADVSEEDAAAVEAAVTEAYPECDISMLSGGQPLYYYIISAE